MQIYSLDQPLQRDSQDFEANLFRLLNLLQESVGVVDVFPSNASLEDYLRTIYVNWVILPPGERENNIAKIAAVTGDGEEIKRESLTVMTFLKR